MPSTQPQDPRPVFARAADQVERLVADVVPEQLERPTSCGDYDVRALLGHVVAVLHKIARVGRGGAAEDLPDVVEGVADDGWLAAYAEARGVLEEVWAPDELLERSFALPWATLPGHALLDAYAHELTVHAWDLAHATGTTGRLDDELAARALDWFRRNVPPEDRGGEGKFSDAVAVADDADVHARLAAYTGRQP